MRPGNAIEVESNKVGVPPRRGTVERVLQEEPLKIEVEWDDGHHSIFEPAGGILHLAEEQS
ncbi:MAG: DUF1918 domain-containing protein [Nitriliruptorales bacterium]